MCQAINHVCWLCALTLCAVVLVPYPQEVAPVLFWLEPIAKQGRHSLAACAVVG